MPAASNFAILLFDAQKSNFFLIRKKTLYIYKYNINKSKGAIRHPTKGLCTPNMEPVHKINYIKRRLAKVCTVPEKKSLDDNILDSMKRRLLSLEDSFVSFPPNSPKNHMRNR